MQIKTKKGEEEKEKKPIQWHENVTGERNHRGGGEKNAQTSPELRLVKN